MDNKLNIKLYLFAFLLTMLGQAFLTMYIPSLPYISQYLNVSRQLILNTITLYLIGYGVSQLFYGPLSDRYGRKKILILGMMILIGGSVSIVFSDTFAEFALLRFIQGIGAGSTMVIIRASLRDFHDGKELAKSTSYLSIGFSIGFGITPLIGGVIQYSAGWQYNFIFLSIISFIVLVLILFLYPESINRKNLIQNISLTATLKLYSSILRDANFLKYLVGGFFIYSIAIAYNVMSPFLFQSHFKFNPQQYGMLGIVIAVPYFVGGFLNSRYVKKLSPEFMIKSGIYVTFISGAGVIIFSVIDPSNFYYLIIFISLSILGQALVWSNALAGAFEGQKANAGTVSSLFSGAQLIFASIISIIFSYIPETSQTYYGIVLIILATSSFMILIKSNK